MSDLRTVIARAEALLPGVRSLDGDADPRWQAIIEVGEYVATDPEPIWDFIARWGSDPDEDLRAAVATCLLEHLLEFHFDSYFPLVQQRVADDPLFGDTFSRCWAFGESERPENLSKFEALKRAARS